MTIRTPLTVFLLSSLSACASLVPAKEAPLDISAVTLPVAYDHLPLISAAEQADAAWWLSFRDGTLNTLIAEALAQNLSLEEGLSNIRQARAAVTSAGAALKPSADASASASSDTDRGLDDISSSARLSAAYEIDLFGANRASLDASKASLEASLFDQRALELSVSADVASNYFNLLATRNQLDVAKRNLTISERIFGIVETRYKAGAVSGFDMASQRSSIATARARIPQIENQIQGYEAAIAILLGRAPQGFTVAETDLDVIVLPSIDPGLPSDLLVRRPDILSVESSLRAANLNVDVARAAFLPSINLGAGLNTLIEDFDPVGSLSASVSLPLFTGGRLEGQLESAKARAEASLIRYRQTVLSALQDVDVSLSGYNTALARANDLKDAHDSADEALSIAEIRYKAGADDLTSLLNAQQTAFSAQQDVLDNRRDQLVAAVNLYTAIGGGWAE